MSEPEALLAPSELGSRREHASTRDLAEHEQHGERRYGCGVDGETEESRQDELYYDEPDHEHRCGNGSPHCGNASRRRQAERPILGGPHSSGVSMRPLRLASALLVMMLVVPSTAAAHLRSGTVAVDYRASVSSPRRSPRAPLSAGIYQSDLALHVSVRRGHKVMVLGYLGESFLRIDAAGVAVNAASPTAAASGLLHAGERTTGNADWLRRGRNSVVWHDARVRQLAPGAQHGEWTVPILVDGRHEAITGEVWRVPPPALWVWLVIVVALTALAAGLALRATPVQLQTLCVVFGVCSAATAIVAAAGFALGTYASAGTWVAGVDELLFAVAGAGVLAWGPRAARAAAGAALGLLGLAVGLSRGAIFLHGSVLSALPGTAGRVAVSVAVATGAAAAVAGGLHYGRLEEPPRGLVSGGSSRRRRTRRSPTVNSRRLSSQA